MSIIYCLLPNIYYLLSTMYCYSLEYLLKRATHLSIDNSFKSLNIQQLIKYLREKNGSHSWVEMFFVIIF